MTIEISLLPFERTESMYHDCFFSELNAWFLLCRFFVKFEIPYFLFDTICSNFQIYPLVFISSTYQGFTIFIYIGPLVTLQGGSAACSVHDTLFNLFLIALLLTTGFFHICPNMKNGFRFARSLFIFFLIFIYAILLLF